MSVSFRFVHMLESQSQQLVAERECQKYSTRWACSDEARAENDIGLLVDERLKQSWKFVAVVFQVGILHDDESPLRRCETGS